MKNQIETIKSLLAKNPNFVITDYERVSFAFGLTSIHKLINSKVKTEYGKGQKAYRRALKLAICFCGFNPNVEYSDCVCPSESRFISETQRCKNGRLENIG